MSLSIEVLTPRGRTLNRSGLDRVVLRRREDGFELGSELAILPRHGDMMVRLPECDIRMLSGGEEATHHVFGGYAEVTNDTITILADDDDSEDEHAVDLAR